MLTKGNGSSGLPCLILISIDRCSSLSSFVQTYSLLVMISTGSSWVLLNIDHLLKFQVFLLEIEIQIFCSERPDRQWDMSYKMGPMIFLLREQSALCVHWENWNVQKRWHRFLRFSILKEFFKTCWYHRDKVGIFSRLTSNSNINKELCMKHHH